MAERVLRLRPHHCLELYLYQLYEGKEGYVKKSASRHGDDPRGRDFVKQVAEKLAAFWNNEYTHVDVVTTADDICDICRKDCDYRDEPEMPGQDFRSKGLELRRYTVNEMQDFVYKTYGKVEKS